MTSISAELGRGVLGAADLRKRLGVSPPTLMRAVQEAGAAVVAIGRGRATRYALRQTWSMQGTSRFPVVRISQDGAPRPEGELLTLAAGQTVWMPAGDVRDGLPVELADARPAGFLGRHFATTHADLRLPARLTDWSDHHILLAVSRRGEDLPGNLVVGDESFERWQRLAPSPVTRGDYPALVEATIAGHPPGSSAGGERPKFGALVDGRHVLVKFAARGDAVATRWCDLLVLEALAHDVLSSHGVPAARTTIVETGSHRFLESERFDRSGPRGRTGVVSLAAVQEDPSDSWARSAVILQHGNHLSREDGRRLQWLDAFGAMIANTDRHPHNVLFFTERADARLRLAPSFDQVPMLYAPTADGRVAQQAFGTPLATADTLEVWADARLVAREYWLRAGNDDRLSEDARAFSNQNANALVD